MSEEFTFDQFLRDSSAVDLYEILVLPITGVVQCPCNEFLARAALTVDDHSSQGSGCLGYFVFKLDDLGAFTNDLPLL